MCTRFRKVRTLAALPAGGAPAAACFAFVLAGLAMLPYNGIESNEALFAGPYYAAVPRTWRIHTFHRDFALMVMDYIGTLKTAIWWPVFRLWQPSAWSVRLPALLVGIVTVLAFHRLLERAAGRRAANAGALLLATDTMFLMTTVFDWGPVALQHLSLTCGCLLLLAFHQEGSWRALAGGCFFFGAGLWDKAVFVWILSGVALAAAAVFPKSVVRKLTARNCAVALAGFVLGAWPLVVFNARNEWRTFRNSASFTTEGLAGKAAVLGYTVEGSGLFGYMVNDPEPGARTPRTRVEAASVRVAVLSGEPRKNWLAAAFALAAVLFPFWRRRWRAVAFAAAAMAVAWIEMALTRNAGGAVHHAVLLWPLPHFVLAVTFAEASRRPARLGRGLLVAAVASLCLANALLTNQYLSQMIRFGSPAIWTDAVYPLSAGLPEGGGDIFVMDYGIYESLLLLRQGRLPLRIMFSPGGGLDGGRVDEMLAAGKALFVGHARGRETFPAGAQMENEARSRGYMKEVLRRILDRNGREMFEVYRFVRRA